MSDGFFIPKLAPKIKELIAKQSPPGVSVYFGGLKPTGGVMRGVTLSYLVADMMYAVGAMVAVFSYLW
jgi:hypothetical protein